MTASTPTSRAPALTEHPWHTSFYIIHRITKYDFCQQVFEII